MNKQPETRRTRCQVAADFGGYAGESEDCLPGMVDYLEGAGEGEDVVRVVVGGLPLSLEFVEGVGEFPDGSGEMLHVSGVLESASGFTATSAPAGSSRRELRRAGVPRDHIYRDVGASGSTGTQERRGWHRLTGRLAGRDTLVVVAIDRIGRRWPDTIRSICELRDLGVKIRSLAETGVGIIGMAPPYIK